MLGSQGLRLVYVFLTKASPSLASRATPPQAGNTPTMATLSRPFVKLSGLKAALYAHGVFIKVVFILRDIFCCLFRLIFSTLPLFSLQTTKILLTIFFAFFFGIVLPVLSWQTFHCFFGCGWQAFFRFPNEFINIQNTLKILSFLPYN